MKLELINRDDAIAIVKYSKDPVEGIKHLPAVDAVEVVHGRWEHNNEYVLWAEKYVCSICGRNALSDGDYRHELSNYCPNCGARMDGE